jgi:hypothetical protein
VGAVAWGSGGVCEGGWTATLPLSTHRTAQHCQATGSN